MMVWSVVVVKVVVELLVLVVVAVRCWLNKSGKRPIAGSGLTSMPVGARGNAAAQALRQRTGIAGHAHTGTASTPSFARRLASAAAAPPAPAGRQ